LSRRAGRKRIAGQRFLVWDSETGSHGNDNLSGSGILHNRQRLAKCHNNWK